MAYFVADEKLQGYYVSDGVTINIVKYHFECDDAASLPAQTAFITSKKVKISMASTAHTIDADAIYKMDSSGAWVQQSQPWQPLADYSVLANKPQINGHTLTGNQSGADLGLQNALTFDANPTQNSTNPVTSGGIWTDQQRQDALQDEDRVALVELVDSGAKNLIDMSLENIKSANTTGGTWNGNVFTTTSGMTFTVNSDGTITASSRANITSTTFLNLVVSQDFASGETLALSGCPEGGSALNGYSIILYASDSLTRLAVDQGAGASFAANYNSTKLSIRFQTGKTYAEKTFKPMICTKSAWKISQSFQPYRPSWQEMYNMILALQ